MALSRDANLLLFDEPTAQLDYFAKLRLAETAQRTWSERQFSAIYVTHDIDEAILLADRILVLDQGRMKAEVRVPLDRPRTGALVASREFFQLRQDVLRRFAE